MAKTNEIQYFYDINKVDAKDLYKWFIQFINQHERTFYDHSKVLVSCVADDSVYTIRIGMDDFSKMHLVLIRDSMCMRKNWFPRKRKYIGCDTVFIEMLVILKKDIENERKHIGGKLSKYSKEELVSILIKELKKKGSALKVRELQENPEMPSLTTIYKVFETYSIKKVWAEVIEYLKENEY